MTREEREKQIDRLARAHADACRVKDRDLAKLLVSMMARHTRILLEEAPCPK